MNNSESLKKIQEISAHLPNTFVRTPDHGNPQIHFTGGSEFCHLWFRFDDRNGKLEVHGNFHFPVTQKDGSVRTEFIRGDNRVPMSITVSLSRTPEAIAKDIARRFLVGYGIEFGKALARRDAQEAQGAGIARSRALIADLVGDTVSAHQRDREMSLYLKRGDENCRLEFRVNGPESIECAIRTGLTMDQLTQVINLLKGF